MFSLKNFIKKGLLWPLFYTGVFYLIFVGILTIVLGVLIMFDPFSTMEMLVVAIGVIIIYNGVSNLLIELGYRRIYK